MSAHQKGILALITANIIWGAASPIFKFSLQNISPFTLAFIRFYGASLILLPLAFPFLKIARKDWLKLFLIAFFGVTVNISFFFLGLKTAPSINVPIIGSSGAVFIYLASIIFLKEKPHFKVLSGIIVSLIGVLVIVGEPLFKQQLNGQIIGNFFFILAMFGAVAHAIFSKEILTEYKASTIAFWTCFIGSISFLPLFIGEIFTGSALTNLDYRGITGIIFGIFLSSALAYTLFEYGVKYIKAQDVGIFTYIDPIVAVLIAVPLLGEKITALYLLGSLLVFGGIFIAEGRIHYHSFHRLNK